MTINIRNWPSCPECGVELWPNEFNSQFPVGQERWNCKNNNHIHRYRMYKSVGKDKVIGIDDLSSGK